MERNLAAIRQLVYDRLDWAPTTSAEQTLRTNRAINRALLQLAKDCPNAYFQGTGWFETQPDGIPTLDTDVLTVAATGNAWVLETAITQATTSALQIPVDRTWDGRTLHLTDSDDVVHRIIIRSAYDAGGDKIRFSLYTPWINITDASIPYRVVTEAYYLPDDVMQVKAVQLMQTGTVYPMDIVGQDQAEQFFWNDSTENVSVGPPVYAYRQSPFKMPSPTRAPVLDAAGIINWTGTEAGGEFDYCYTYAWGSRKQDWQDPGPAASASTSGAITKYEALWESAPSPILEGVPITYGADAAYISFPNIEYMQGFGDVANARYLHSGWHIRLYRRRNTSVGGSFSSVETPNAFFYLDEVPASGFQYIDNGFALPDYLRPLREIHSYQALMFYPRPDQEYNVKVRYCRRPVTLSDDYDTPMVYPEATDAVILMTCAYMYESQGNMPLRDRMVIDYNAELVTLQNRYGDLRPPGVPLRRRLASAQRNARIRKWW